MGLLQGLSPVNPFQEEWFDSVQVEEALDCSTGGWGPDRLNFFLNRCTQLLKHVWISFEWVLNSCCIIVVHAGGEGGGTL